MTQQALAALERRAAEGLFSEAELAEAEPLLAAAETEPEKRATRMDALIEKRNERTQRQTDALVAVRNARPGVAKKTTSKPEPKTAAPAPVGELGEPKDPFADDGDEPSARGDSRGSGPEPLSREKRDPKVARALANKGMTAFRSGDYKHAILRFEQALAKNPKDKVALIGMRDLYFDRSDYGRSTRYGLRVVKLAPKNASHRLRLGDAYFKVARYSAAEKEYKQALDLGDSRAKERLARARKLLGK
jgi:tetratricopeptide (TPR) repeat protein